MHTLFRGLNLSLVLSYPWPVELLLLANNNIQVWSKDNSSIVNRIEVLMDRSFLYSWNETLENENRSKMDHPFEYTIL